MIKVIELIEDVKCKLGEIYDDDFIKIKNDNLYINELFAKYLIQRDFKIKSKHVVNYYHTKYSIRNFNSSVGIYIKEYNGSNGLKYSIAGSSGSYGFNGLQHTLKETLGVRTKRIVNKKILEIYKDSYFIRSVKIKKIINDINSKHIK